MPRCFELHRPGRVVPFQAQDEAQLRQLLRAVTLLTRWSESRWDEAVRRLWRGGLVALDERTLVLRAGIVR